MNVWYDAHLVLIQGTLINVLLALSVQVPLRMGVFSFAGAGSYGIGAYATAIMVTRYDYSAAPAIVVGAVIAAVAGFVLSLIVARLDGLYLAMTTIAFDLILSVVVLNGGSFTGGSEGLFGIVTDLPMIAMVILVVVILLVSAWTERGRIGRKIEAVREDIPLASTMGINVVRMRRIAFVVSGAVGGLAGGLNVTVRSVVTPDDIGFPLIVLALTMIVIGGARSWLGAVLGAIIFTWLPSVLSLIGSWQQVVYGVLVALAAIWVPGGLVGLSTTLFRTVEARRRRPETGDTLPPADVGHQLEALGERHDAEAAS